MVDDRYQLEPWVQIPHLRKKIPFLKRLVAEEGVALTIEIRVSLFLHQDMQDCIMSIPSTRMNRDTTWFVDNQDAIFFPHHFDGQVCHWGFMSMDRMSDNVTVLDNIILVHSLAIDLNSTILNGSFIKFVVPVPKLSVEDLDQGPSKPSTFCIRLIFEKVRVDLPEV